MTCPTPLPLFDDPLDHRRIAASLRLEEALRHAQHACAQARLIYLSAKAQVPVPNFPPVEPTPAMLAYQSAQVQAQRLLERVRTLPEPKAPK